jgi:hypothetical protein
VGIIKASRVQLASGLLRTKEETNLYADGALRLTENHKREDSFIQGGRPPAGVELAMTIEHIRRACAM